MAAVADAYTEPILIDNPDDCRVAVFANLKDSKAAVRDGLFIAEGPETIKLLLRNTLEIVPQTVLLKPTVYERLKEDIKKCKYSPQVFLMSPKVMAKLVCFESCRGSLASGFLPLHLTFNFCLENTLLQKKNNRWRILAVDGSNNTANVGSMIRSASAFGLDLIILSHDCCDPYYRQSVRVSVGHIFNVPVVKVKDLKSVLSLLIEEHDVQVFAAVIDKDASLLRQILRKPISDRWVAVLGNEDKGISQPIASDNRIVKTRIDMADGVDSLSINNACAIFLFALAASVSSDT